MVTAYEWEQRGRGLGRRAGFYSLRNMGSELGEKDRMAGSIAEHESQVMGWRPARGRVISTGLLPYLPPLWWANVAGFFSATVAAAEGNGVLNLLFCVDWPWWTCLEGSRKSGFVWKSTVFSGRGLQFITNLKQFLLWGKTSKLPLTAAAG